MQKDKPLYNVTKSNYLFYYLKGWFGFYRDDSDFQWREYRANLPIFIPMAVIFLSISTIIKRQFKNSIQAKSVAIKIYYIGSGCGFLVFVFGTGGAIMWLALTFINYLL